MVPRFLFVMCVWWSFFLPAEIKAGDQQETNGPSMAGDAAFNDLNELVNAALKDFNLPGAGLGVVVGGEVVYAEGFGFRDIEAGKPMTPDTLFAIGSTTKAMTATVLGMLVDEGKLEWDQPLRDYLPTFALSDPMISARMTPRDLVTHRSGLPRHDMIWYNNTTSTRSDLVSRMKHLELSADLREKFQYNNLMFMTAGYLAGHLSGQTWEELVKTRLFDPLGMRRSNFKVSQSQQDDDFAYPYRENDDHKMERIDFRNIDVIGPAGCVNSSINEMCKWLLFNLNGGRVGEQQLINAPTLADIHSPQMTMGGTPARVEISQSTYGLGWVIDTYRGHRRIEHGGGIDGFITSVMLFPDDGIGLVSFNNGQSNISELICRHVADRLLGLEPIDWLGEAIERREKAHATESEDKERKAATRVANTNPSHAMEAYVGTYEEPGYGTLQIDLIEDHLQMQYNGIKTPLTHWHYDVWSGAESGEDDTFENQKFIFRGDMDGNIAAIESTFEMRAAPIVFKKRPAAWMSDPEQLRLLSGVFETVTGTKLLVNASDNQLSLTIPGQPTYTLEPHLSGRFVLRELRTFSLEFVFKPGEQATKVLLHQPGSVSEAARIE